MTVDLLAFGAHPDDCELFAGGLLAHLSDLGHSIVICDLTRGEAASRGTPEERAIAAQEASSILGVQDRVALDLGDGGLENTPAARSAVIEIIRKFRPRAILTHDGADRHPDHGRASQLIRECAFYATANGVDAPGERIEDVPALFYFFGNAPFRAIQPDFIVPVSQQEYEKRKLALAAYASQFYHPDDKATQGASLPKTLVSSREYAEGMEARYRHFGAAIRAAYGEPYRWEKTPAISNPLQLVS